MAPENENDANRIADTISRKWAKAAKGDDDGDDGTDQFDSEGHPLVDLTGFQRDLLLVIGKLGESHGLGIKAVIDEVYPSEIKHGRLYPNLDTLAHKSLITKEEADGRTNVYRLTPRGRRELKADSAWRQFESNGGAE